MNIILKYLSILAGVWLAITLAFMNFFVGSIRAIILSTTIKDGVTAVNDNVLYFSCFKIVISGVLFWMILGYFLTMAKSFERQHEENS
jgi:hypothetical protein